MKKNILFILFAIFLFCNILYNPLREGQVSGTIIDTAGGSAGKTPWKVNVDTKGDLVFSYNDKTSSN